MNPLLMIREDKRIFWLQFGQPHTVTNLNANSVVLDEKFLYDPKSSRKFPQVLFYYANEKGRDWKINYEKS